MFSFNKNNVNPNSDGRITLRMRPQDFDILDILANKHGDYILTSLMKHIFDAVGDLLSAGYDVYEPSVVRDIIAGLKDGEE